MMFIKGEGKFTPKFKEWEYNTFKWQMGDLTMIIQWT